MQYVSIYAEKSPGRAIPTWFREVWEATQYDESGGVGPRTLSKEPLSPLGQLLQWLRYWVTGGR